MLSVTLMPNISCHLLFSPMKISLHTFFPGLSIFLKVHLFPLKLYQVFFFFWGGGGGGGGGGAAAEVN